MTEQELRQLKRQQHSRDGWTVDYKELKAICEVANKIDDGFYVGYEEAEAVALAMVELGYAQLENSTDYWRRTLQTLMSMCLSQLQGTGISEETFVSNLHLFADELERHRTNEYGTIITQTDSTPVQADDSKWELCSREEAEEYKTKHPHAGWTNWRSVPDDPRGNLPRKYRRRITPPSTPAMSRCAKDQRPRTKE